MTWVRSVLAALVVALLLAPHGTELIRDVMRS